MTNKFPSNPSLQTDEFANEQIFRAALKNTPVTIFVLDTQLRYTWIFNPTIGQPAEKFIGKKVGEMSEPKDASSLINFYGEVLKNGVARQEEFRLEFEDRVASYEIYAIPLKNSSGEVTGLVASSMDITQFKKPEEEISRLASFPELNPNPIVEVDFDGNVEYVNPEGKKLFPDLEVLGLRHTFLSEWEKVTNAFQDTKMQTFGREVRIGKHWYFQQLSIVPKSRCIRIYAVNFDELKKAEEALSENEKRLNRSQEIAHLGSWELDIVNNKLTWSDEVYRIFGLKPQEFGATYEAFLDAVHPNDRAKVDNAYSGSLREGRDTYEIEHRVVRKSSGEIRVVHEKFEHIRDESGRIIRSVGMVQDITERKKAEEALGKLNRHLRAISNSNQALMHATNEATLTQEVCNIIVHDCGYALVWVGFAEQDKEKTVRPMAYAGFDKDYIDQLNITWADKPRGRGPTGTAIRTGKPYLCRNMQTDPNFKPWREQAAKRGYTASLVLPLSTFENKTFGALNIYSCEPNPFSDEEIKLLTELSSDFAYGIDMLRLRKEREQATEILRKQAELIDLSPDAIIVKELDDTITFWSEGAEKLYGWTKEEVIGQQARSLFRTKSSEPLKDITFKLKQTGHWSGELIHHTKDNREVVVQSWWMGKPDEHGKIKEILESNVDMTERNSIRTKLEEYASQMEKLAAERAKQLSQAERLATIGQTAGMVGHDIRNPLQAIAGELYLAKDELYTMPDSDSKKNLQESITSIEENLYYIDKIVADLQDYTKPLKPSLETVNIEKAIEEALLIVNIPSNLQVSISIEKGFPQFTADFSMLKRVLMNLIQNAVQAMPNGGALKINAKCQDNQACVSIQDTGEGIPEEIKNRLFTPLFTTKSKGQGFGLAVVKRLIEAQGGKINFESQQGKGTTFTIQLPLK